MTAAGLLALALIAGSTVGVLNYLGSRFPNEAERALLGYVPLALTREDSCTRNAEAERGTANVQASVACTSDDDANTIVFTKFTSTKALDQRYQAAVAAAGIGQGSGDCLSAERAEGSYASESGRTSGRVLCYQQRGSSFITWTDEGSQTLGSATRVDPDYPKLRAWWAGVVGLKLPTTEAPQTPAAAPPAAQAAPPEPAPVPPPAPGPDAAESAPKAEENRRQKEDSGRAEESKNREDQPTRAPTTTSSSPTTTPTSPPPPVKLDGPVPAAPGPQQGGPPAPGTGGCTGVTRTGKTYVCTVTQSAPVYSPGTTEPRGALPAGRSPFLCQSKGSKYSVGNRANNWWAWVGRGDAGVWAPTVFLAGGLDNAPVPGLPVCGSAPTTTTTPPTTTTSNAPTTTEAPPTTTTGKTTTTTETP